MEGIRALFGRLFGSEQSDDRRVSRGPALYECQFCRCTFDTQPEECPECRRGRPRPSGSRYQSKTGVRCRSCRMVVDKRYERCPECGGSRFERAD